MPILDFDRQAEAFDRRAGLPLWACREAAEAVASLAGAGWCLDLGAGTGLVGADLARLHPRYVAMDLSLSMLAQFRARRATGQQTPWIRADGDLPWPLRDASVGLIFSSRAAHLLSQEPLLRQVRRVAHADGLTFVVASVQRHEDGVREQMRRQMRRLLQQRGIKVEGKRKAKQRLLERLSSQTERQGETTVVAEWSVTERPADSLNSWRVKNGLAGQALDAEVRHGVLDELETWARGRWGDLGAEIPSMDHYELRAARLAARAGVQETQ